MPRSTTHHEHLTCLGGHQCLKNNILLKPQLRKPPHSNKKYVGDIFFKGDHLKNNTFVLLFWKLVEKDGEKPKSIKPNTSFLLVISMP